VFQVMLDPADGKALHWLHEETEVLDRRTDEASNVLLAVRVAPEKEPRFLHRFPSARRLRSG
jgi:GTP-binding protein HflX